MSLLAGEECAGGVVTNEELEYPGVHGYMLASPYTVSLSGLPAEERGFLMCLDENGKRITLIGDPDYVRMIASAPKDETEGMNIDMSHFPHQVDGWPGDPEYPSGAR